MASYAVEFRRSAVKELNDLAKADPETLAGKIDVIGGRTAIEDWIKQAQEMTSGGALGGE